MMRAVPALFCLLGSAQAAVTADEIKALPGWDDKLPSKHYSGCAPTSTPLRKSSPSRSQADG
jgi:hypothetical protein